MKRILLASCMVVFVGSSALGKSIEMSILIDPFNTADAVLTVPVEEDCSYRDDVSVKECKTPGATFVVSQVHREQSYNIVSSVMLTSDYEGEIFRQYIYKGSFLLRGVTIPVMVVLKEKDGRKQPGEFILNNQRQGYVLALGPGQHQ